MQAIRRRSTVVYVTEHNIKSYIYHKMVKSTIKGLSEIVIMKEIIFTIFIALSVPTIVCAQENIIQSNTNEDVVISNNNSGTRVETNTNTSVNTGGNVISGKNGEDNSGTIQTGDYSVDVKVENTIDGEKQEPIEVKINSKDNPKSYEIKKETEKSKTEVRVNINESLNQESKKILRRGSGQARNQEINESMKEIIKKSNNQKIKSGIFVSIKNVFNKFFKLFSWR